ncbi:amidohydrolase family protein [Roseomonas sp. BN140053]|uniref:metal-dependent hydrolase family protein n=1 Tax=Roseomonas sp. BN140053 TaxID=3391898 RepID=UPI0039EC10F5
MPDSGKRHYIAGARLLDGTGTDHGDRPSALLTDGQRIAAVAPEAELDCPADAVRLDAAGLTLMPGMIDCHDHLAAIGGSWGQRAQISPTLGVLTVAQTLHEMLLTGFTSVRDAGGLDAGMKQAVERGMIPGPRLQISVNLLCQTGGHNHHIEPAGIDRDFPKLPYLPDGICDGPDACRRKTREMIFAGADWVKFCTTGGISSRTGGPLVCQFSREEVRAIVDTAHTAGKPAMVHAYGGEGVDIALEAGVDSIEHGAALTEAQIERMAAQGTWLVPTFAVFRKVLAIQAADPAALPDYVARKARDLLERQAESFPKAVAAGLKIALGTDLGPFQHNRNAVEFGHMVEGGMTPMQAIVAGTGAAADCIGLGDRVGRLRPGMLADLLLVDGDPLQDIRVLEDPARLRLIMQDGAIIKHDTRPRKAVMHLS